MRVGYTTLRANSISRNDQIAALFRSKIDPNVQDETQEKPSANSQQVLHIGTTASSLVLWLLIIVLFLVDDQNPPWETLFSALLTGCFLSAYATTLCYSIYSRQELTAVQWHVAHSLYAVAVVSFLIVVISYGVTSTRPASPTLSALSAPSTPPTPPSPSGPPLQPASPLPSPPPSPSGPLQQPTPPAPLPPPPAPSAACVEYCTNVASSAASIHETVYTLPAVVRGSQTLQFPLTRNAAPAAQRLDIVRLPLPESNAASLSMFIPFDVASLPERISLPFGCECESW